ncbi:MAG TPA: hypothetical protein VIK93_05625 [Limnochordales bacterium]
MLAGAAAGAPDVEDVVANLNRAAGLLPADMGFRQDVQLQLFFITWRFYSDVVRRNGEFQVTTYGKPGFLSDDVPTTLLQLHTGIDEFDLELVGEETNSNGDPLYVLEGRRRVPGPGAQAGKLWVNGRTWLAEKAWLEYDWGTLDVEQEFQEVDGYTVLRAQRARSSLVGTRLVVEYRDYWFGNDDTIAREDH